MNEIISASLPVSVTLGGTAILIALAIGLGAGVIGAVRPNSAADIGTLIIALVGISLPSFVIGTVLLLVFPVLLGIGKVGEWGTLRAMVLPAVTLSLPFAAYIARLTRIGMIDSLGADYIRTARAKGVSHSGILIRHALKNAFLPVLSYLGPATALAMTGSFIVENLFQIPGTGVFFVNSFLNRDYPMMIALAVLYSVLLQGLNLASDLALRSLDPRVRHA